LSERREAL